MWASCYLKQVSYKHLAMYNPKALEGRLLLQFSRNVFCVPSSPELSLIEYSLQFPVMLILHNTCFFKTGSFMKY